MCRRLFSAVRSILSRIVCPFGMSASDSPLEGSGKKGSDEFTPNEPPIETPHQDETPTETKQKDKKGSKEFTPDETPTETKQKDKKRSKEFTPDETPTETKQKDKKGSKEFTPDETPTETPQQGVGQRFDTDKIFNEFTPRSISTQTSQRQIGENYGTFNQQKQQNRRKDFSTMSKDERRPYYSCGKKYLLPNKIVSWPDYVKANHYFFTKKGLLNKGDKFHNENDEINSKVSLWRGDITCLEIDAIVNAANTSLRGGGGVDGCIHRAAGRGLLEECIKLHGCETGNAKITSGHMLPAEKVIHTVGPIGEKKKELQSCYDSCLELVKKHKLRTVAFCCISTGIYGYPNSRAAKVALTTVKEWLEKNKDEVDRIIFCVYLERDLNIYHELMLKYFPCTVSPVVPCTSATVTEVVDVDQDDSTEKDNTKGRSKGDKERVEEVVESEEEVVESEEDVESEEEVEIEDVGIKDGGIKKDGGRKDVGIKDDVETMEDGGIKKVVGSILVEIKEDGGSKDVEIKEDVETMEDVRIKGDVGSKDVGIKDIETVEDVGIKDDVGSKEDGEINKDVESKEDVGSKKDVGNGSLVHHAKCEGDVDICALESPGEKSSEEKMEVDHSESSFGNLGLSETRESARKDKCVEKDRSKAFDKKGKNNPEVKKRKWEDVDQAKMDMDDEASEYGNKMDTEESSRDE